MEKINAKEFLTKKGYDTTDSRLLVIIEEYADLKIKESQHIPIETFRVDVKNVDCDFDELRDRLDKISPSFTLDKDSFIFTSCDMPTYVSLCKLRDSLKEHAENIIVSKES